MKKINKILCGILLGGLACLITAGVWSNYPLGTPGATDTFMFGTLGQNNIITLSSLETLLNNQLTFDPLGRGTAVTNGYPWGSLYYPASGNPSSFLTGNQTITFSGAASGSGTTSIPLTLANTGTAGTYFKTTYNAFGLETSGSNPTTFSGFGISETSAGLAGVISDETGSGSLVFATHPTLASPVVSGVTNGDIPAGFVWQSDPNKRAAPVSLDASNMSGFISPTNIDGVATNFSPVAGGLAIYTGIFDPSNNTRQTTNAPNVALASSHTNLYGTDPSGKLVQIDSAAFNSGGLAGGVGTIVASNKYNSFMVWSNTAGIAAGASITNVIFGSPTNPIIYVVFQPADTSTTAGTTTNIQVYITGYAPGGVASTNPVVGTLIMTNSGGTMFATSTNGAGVAGGSFFGGQFWADTNLVAAWGDTNAGTTGGGTGPGFLVYQGFGSFATNTYAMTSTGFTNKATRNIQVFEFLGTSVTYSNSSSKTSFSFGSPGTLGVTFVLRPGCSVTGTGCSAAKLEDF